jgi:hypothetical protein
VLNVPVEVYREAQDGGRDAVFVSRKKLHEAISAATIQCKFTSKQSVALKLDDVRTEEELIRELVKTGEAETYIFMTNKSVSGVCAASIKRYLRELGVTRPHVFG